MCPLVIICRCWDEKCKKPKEACKECPKHLTVCERNHMPCNSECKLREEKYGKLFNAEI